VTRGGVTAGSTVGVIVLGGVGIHALLGRPRDRSGRVVVVGYAVCTAIELPSARLVLDEIDVVGSRYVARDELERAIRLVAGGRVQTVVDRVLPLDRAEDALAALEASDVVGRVVLDVAGRYQSPDPSPTSPARR
jgi:NADPH:quinone reductase-like Zn-dependent oxidoreductase